MEWLVDGIDAITFSEAIDAEGAIVFAHACKLGLERIVSKRPGGVYSSGPCWNWVKCKDPAYVRRLPMPRDGAFILSDLRSPTLSIVCEPCGRHGTYNVARLMEQHGDAKLTDLLRTLADCPKGRSASIHDRCKAVFEQLLP